MTNKMGLKRNKWGKEKSLHLALKKWYSKPGDEFEVPVNGYIIDIVRNDVLIEIQTKNFAAIKIKLLNLLKDHKVRLVYPITKSKTLVYFDEKNPNPLKRRKSPRKGNILDIFYELVRIPKLINMDNFSIDVLIIEEEELRSYNGKGSWRRRGISIKDRKLKQVLDIVKFRDEKDFHKFLPPNLKEPFTNRELSEIMCISRNLCQKITYCLEKMNVIKRVGKKKKNQLLFQKVTTE